jgi:16S rRNA (cytosine1402-N4)-methyltransferase
MLSNKEINDNNQGDENSEAYHIPVLLVETVEGLSIKENGIYVDCTFGGGGHSKEILKKLGSGGRLFVFDQDMDAKANLPEDERVEFIPQNFRHIQRFLRLLGVQKVDGILADLGVSSHQFDEAERGFSIRFDADLDMRMDKRQLLTAVKVLATYDEQALHKLFEKYGEVSNSKTLARTIVAKRNHMPLQTINQFKQVIREVVMGNPNKYLAKVFQAIRIEVNDEMGALKDLLEQSLNLLNPGGRIAIITFHSLEDRMVKNFFKTGSIEEVQADDVFGIKPKSPLKIITKKPIEAKEAELKRNNRSRSAGLRIAEKI